MPAYEFCDHFRLFGKFGWERLSLEMFGDQEDGYGFDASGTVLPDFVASGDDYLFYGAGLEYFPLKDNRDIRLHAAWSSNAYTKRHAINVGLTWQFDVARAIARAVRNNRK